MKALKVSLAFVLHCHSFHWRKRTPQPISNSEVKMRPSNVGAFIRCRRARPSRLRPSRHGCNGWIRRS